MVLEECRVEDHVKSLGAKVVQCLLKADTASLSEILDDGFVLRQPDGQLISKDQWLQLLATGQIRYDSLVAEFTDVHVYDGQVAFVSGYTVSSKTYCGQQITGRFPYTVLYVCRAGEWHIVAIHQIESAHLLETAGRTKVGIDYFSPIKSPKRL